VPRRTPWFDLETDAGDADLTIVGVPFDGSVSLRAGAQVRMGRCARCYRLRAQIAVLRPEDWTLENVDIPCKMTM